MFILPERGLAASCVARHRYEIWRIISFYHMSWDIKKARNSHYTAQKQSRIRFFKYLKCFWKITCDNFCKTLGVFSLINQLYCKYLYFFVVLCVLITSTTSICSVGAATLCLSVLRVKWKIFWELNPPQLVKKTVHYHWMIMRALAAKSYKCLHTVFSSRS